MKAAVFYGKHDICVEQTIRRALKSDEVVVQVKACGVCGTDIHIYEGDEGAAACTPPTILGHEFAGIVCEVGSDVQSVKVGDRVCVDPNDMCGACYYCRNGQAHFCEHMVGIGTTVNGGFAEYCTVRAKQVYPIADTLTFEEAAMAEPVACCLHGIDLTGIQPGDTVMIIGGGPIGLIMLQLARLAGASTLILLEPVEIKREKALQLGADLAIDPIGQDVPAALRKANIQRIHSVIECVGLPGTMQDAIRYVGKGGTVMLFGLTAPQAEIPLEPFYIFQNEITIKSSFINPYTQDRALALLESGRVRVKELFAAEIPLDEIGRVFVDSALRTEGKIIVKP